MKRSPLLRRTALARVSSRIPAPRKRQRATGFDRPTRARIFDRDGDRCCLCGFIFDRRDLVAHHRRNRGSGGSTDPETNSVRNGLTLCWGDNGLIESSAPAAAQARARGIKLRRGDSLATPVTYPDGERWELLDNGQRRRLERAA